jgi:hypothetical protein
MLQLSQVPVVKSCNVMICPQAQTDRTGPTAMTLPVLARLGPLQAGQ